MNDDANDRPPIKVIQLIGSNIRVALFTAEPPCSGQTSSDEVSYTTYARIGIDRETGERFTFMPKEMTQEELDAFEEDPE